MAISQFDRLDRSGACVVYTLVMRPFLASLTFLLVVCSSNLHAADFVETFEGNHLHRDPVARDGWAWMTGDGDAVMAFSQREGMGIVEVDARKDRRNIWWALIRRSVTGNIDTTMLARPDRELRVEAKIRSSAAPRRVNLHFNHSRTTDFHSHLMEFDIPVANTWQVISMTTRGFDAQPGDDVFVQMALMDWGREQYRLDIDYVEVSVVDPATAGQDLGEPLPYRPELPVAEEYAHRLVPQQDGVVDTAWPQMNFKGWKNRGEADGRPLIVAGGSKIAVLRWNLEAFNGQAPRGWGVLELTTEQVYIADNGIEGADQLRVVEILGGSSDWTSETLSWNSLSADQAFSEVINSQMMIDISPNVQSGGKTRIAVSPPVLRRLFSGRAAGLAIQAQGAIQASFKSGQEGSTEGPVLYFNSD